MKITFLTIILAFFTGVLSAQEVYESIAKETCECLDKKEIVYNTITKSELQTEIGLCMIQSYSEHLKEFSAEEKTVLEDSDGMRAMGEKVGIKMVSICPTTILSLGKANGNSADLVEEDAYVIGTIKDIKSQQFVTLEVRDKNGRTYHFIVLDYFDTAGLLTNNELKKNDEVIVSYTERELYDPASKDFRYFKIITGLERQ